MFRAKVAMMSLMIAGAVGQPCSAEPVEGYECRRPRSERERRYWLEIMSWHYGFSVAEIKAATGLDEAEIESSLEKFQIAPETRPERAKDAPLLLQPWPGGRNVSNWGNPVERTRHRETKAGVFAPWDPTSYIVFDIPEVIRGKYPWLYTSMVAHEDMRWTVNKIALEKLEWNRRDDGSLDLTREFPNKVVYTARLVPFRNAVRMRLTLTNGTDDTLDNLSVQNCVFLTALKGFENEAKPMAPVPQDRTPSSPYNARGTADGKRWVITAWVPCVRIWGNPRNPCFHSDPKFPDCAPGATQAVYGWFSFYEGSDIQGEFGRIDRTGWREDRWEDTPAWSESSQGYR